MCYVWGCKDKSHISAWARCKTHDRLPVIFFFASSYGWGTLSRNLYTRNCWGPCHSQGSMGVMSQPAVYAVHVTMSQSGSMGAMSQSGVYGAMSPCHSQGLWGPCHSQGSVGTVSQLGVYGDNVTVRGPWGLCHSQGSKGPCHSQGSMGTMS